MRFLPCLPVLLLCSIFVFLVGCGGGEDDVPDFPTVVSLGEGDIFPSIINTSLAVGENRVVWQLIDAEDNPVSDAEIHVRYFDLNDETTFSSEADARFISTETSFIDENNNKERTVTGTVGVYITYTAFDRAGRWGAELTTDRDGESDVTTYQFNVMEHPIEPGIGDPAPPSAQATTATEPIESIDSSFPTRNAMHTTTVADAISAGKPMIIAFATPAYCTSRTCAPVMDEIMDPLAAEYGDEAIFIHIEPFLLRDLREANARNPVPAVLDWRLQGEPWVFVVGSDGNVAAKFEGIAALDEVQSALDLALGGASSAEPTP